MRPTGLIATLILAAAVGACGDGDGDFFTAPGSPGSGAPALAAECSGDADAPAITSVRALPEELWPPNHEMVPVTVHADAEDGCGPVDISIVEVRSDEPINGVGDGDTAPDWNVDGPLVLRLRAERAGTGDGRVYTIRVRFADAVGNERFEYVTVRVPHDEGGGA